MSDNTLTAKLGAYVAEKLRVLRAYVDTRFASLTIRGEQITEGEVPPERLPKGTTNLTGAVKLSDEITVDSTVAATPTAVKKVMDRIDEIQTTQGDKYYRHVQGIPSKVWEIHHTLSKYPSVTVTDTAGTIVEGQIEYISDSIIKVSFAAPFSGKAELN